VEPRENTDLLWTNTSETEAMFWDSVFPALNINRIQSHRTLLPKHRVQAL